MILETIDLPDTLLYLGAEASDNVPEGGKGNPVIYCTQYHAKTPIGLPEWRY